MNKFLTPRWTSTRVAITWIFSYWTCCQNVFVLLYFKKKYTLPSRGLNHLQIIYLDLETPTLTPEVLPVYFPYSLLTNR
jgi:hypothetical protein